jgi:hypothetical protein
MNTKSTRENNHISDRVIALDNARGSVYADGKVSLYSLSQ